MEKTRSRTLISTLFIIIGLIMCDPIATARAKDRCTEWVAKMESIQGVVQVRRAGDTEWTFVKPNETFCPGDTVRTLENSRAALRLPNESLPHLDQGTTVTFNGIEKGRTSLLDIIKGIIHFFSRTPRALKVTTPFVNGTVEGTEFFVKVAPDHTVISVFQGNVLAANDVGSLNLVSKQSAIARAGEAPMAYIVARPWDAVQWAIYTGQRIFRVKRLGRARFVNPYNITGMGI
jgi:ferric-dicitrate binding protein FerR (iron transport regulator)